MPGYVQALWFWRWKNGLLERELIGVFVDRTAAVSAAERDAHRWGGERPIPIQWQHHEEVGIQLLPESEEHYQITRLEVQV